MQLSRLEAVFEAAASVFAQYGFRRTSMSDIAGAAGLSRAALYLMFANKEDLFRQLANHRQAEAIDQAVGELASDGTVAARVTNAVLAYERIYYEPVAGSPHGVEFLELNRSVASADMAQGRARLLSHLADAIEAAASRGEARLPADGMPIAQFVDLMMHAVNGMKGVASSIDDFRQKITAVIGIFMAVLSVRVRD